MRPSILSLFLIALVATAASAQVTIYPSELYSSQNVLTVRVPGGIRSISVRHTSNMTVTGTGTFAGCPIERTLDVFVETVDQEATLNVTIVDCRGRSYQKQLNRGGQSWRLDQVAFGTVEAGSTRCQNFHIAVDQRGDEVLDSVTVNDPRVRIKLPGRLPYRLRRNEEYEYMVCFTADQPGVYTFPVTTWMRRTQSAGGYTTYPVSDTGIVRVVPKTIDRTTPPSDTIRRRPERIPTRRTPAPIIDEIVTDPTTFRSVAVPNAVIPPRGTAFVGSYDFLGLMAGYVPVDNVMILAGGALPTPDDWTGVRGDMFGAYSIGLKAGISLTANLDIAAGYQWGRSIFDQAVTVDTVESRITISAPYAALSFGDDDSRVSGTFGYVFKHHEIPTGGFDTTAAVFALGGDYRFSNHWKVAGEVAYMQTLGVIPIVGSVRYFTNDYALDLGVGFVGITIDGGAAPKIPLLPVISGVFVF